MQADSLNKLIEVFYDYYFYSWRELSLLSLFYILGWGALRGAGGSAAGGEWYMNEKKNSTLKALSKLQNQKNSKCPHVFKKLLSTSLTHKNKQTNKQNSPLGGLSFHLSPSPAITKNKNWHTLFFFFENRLFFFSNFVVEKI